MDAEQAAVERLALGEEEWLTQVGDGKAPEDGYPVHLREVLPPGFPRYVRVFHPNDRTWLTPLVCRSTGD